MSNELKDDAAGAPAPAQPVTADAGGLSEAELQMVAGGTLNGMGGLPMGDLIGGPLMAAGQAQVRSANVTAAFLQQIGKKP